jgi:hypothetical protein
MSLNFGYSSRLGYDNCAYTDKLSESVSPLTYRLDGNQIYNCNGCLSTLGPRGRFGTSSAVGHPVAESQALVDVESILTNRNVKTTKCKRGEINHINPAKFKGEHANICNSYMDPMASRLMYPAMTYREMGMNRFYNLTTDPQQPIFYDFSVNTTLEAKDNFIFRLPVPHRASALPTELKGAGNEILRQNSAYCSA